MALRVLVPTRNIGPLAGPHPGSTSLSFTSLSVQGRRGWPFGRDHGISLAWSQSGVSWPSSACLRSSTMCVLWGRGGAGRKLYVILGWDSGNCFNEMECSLFRTHLAETAMFCSVFLLGRAGHTFPAVSNRRTLGE